MWTANNQRKGFMAITTHFIDDSWILQARLGFLYLPCPHDAKTLGDGLIDCLYNWNLDCKLSTVTVDNCTTNDRMIDTLLPRFNSVSVLLNEDYFHMRCAAYILSLIVDGLDVIKKSIAIIRSSISYWTHSPKREETFVEVCHKLKIESIRSLTLDCETRWNSTYTMLSTTLIYEDVFPRLKNTKYTNVPSKEDGTLTKLIVEKLKLFYDATKVFSGTKYPTSNLFFPTICDIRLAINDWLESEHDEVKEMAMRMSLKFDKYSDTIHGMLAIATIVDPRYKMKLIEFYFPLIYKENTLVEIERVRKLSYALVYQYKLRSQSQPRGSSQPSISQYSLSPHIGVGGNMHKFELFVSECSSSDVAKSDLDHYLDKKLLPRTVEFDILAWWKVSGKKFPIIRDIARDILAIPVLTIALESAFSTSGRIVSPQRNRLQSNTVESLMCARDWLWSKMRGSTSDLTSINIEPGTFYDDIDVQIVDNDGEDEDD